MTVCPYVPEAGSLSPSSAAETNDETFSDVDTSSHAVDVSTPSVPPSAPRRSSLNTYVARKGASHGTEPSPFRTSVGPRRVCFFADGFQTLDSPSDSSSPRSSRSINSSIKPSST